MAEILDEHEEKAVHMFLDEANPEGDKFYWIGLTDLAHEGVWVWISSGKEADYTNWNKGEPNNLDGIEHFARIYFQLYERKWNDCANESSKLKVSGSCSVGSYALCQYIL